MTAYLIPDGVVIISLAVAAKDGCGCDKMDVPPTMVATEVDRNARRLPTAADLVEMDSLPIDKEKALTLEPVAMAAAARKRTDFMMGLCLVFGLFRFVLCSGFVWCVLGAT